MHWRGWTTALVCVFVSLTYALVGHLLGQDVDFDLLNYPTSSTAYWLLVNHMQDAAPAWLQTYYNPFIDIPFYFAARSFPRGRWASALPSFRVSRFRCYIS